MFTKPNYVLRRACGHVDVGTSPHQVLAATLTLSQPVGADYTHPILVSTPSFESHRRAWTTYMYVYTNLLNTFKPLIKTKQVQIKGRAFNSSKSKLTI